MSDAALSSANLRRRRGLDSILRWCLLIAAIVFGFVVLLDFGFIAFVFDNDTSRISLLIVAILVAMSAYCLYRLILDARELAAAEEILAALEAGEALHLGPEGLRTGAAAHSGDGPVGRVITDIVRQRGQHAEAEPDVLLSAFGWEMRAAGRRGIFVADMVYKLGMLGTVIGFIVMLASMRDLADFDPDTMRDALQQMTGGMAVALLTTISGLVCGMLLRLQFNIVDAQAMRVVQTVVRIVESYAPVAGRHV